jgi:hypothetical protein
MKKLLFFIFFIPYLAFSQYVTVGDIAVVEGSPAKVPMYFSIPTPANVTISYTLTDGTATTPADYTVPNPATLAVPAGTTFIEFSIPTVQETTPEATETFILTIVSPPSGYTFGDAAATISILANDQLQGIDAARGLQHVAGLASVDNVAIDDNATLTSQYFNATTGTQFGFLRNNLTLVYYDPTPVTGPGLHRHVLTYPTIEKGNDRNNYLTLGQNLKMDGKYFNNIGTGLSGFTFTGDKSAHFQTLTNGINLPFFDLKFKSENAGALNVGLQGYVYGATNQLGLKINTYNNTNVPALELDYQGKLTLPQYLNSTETGTSYIGISRATGKFTRMKTPIREVIFEFSPSNAPANIGSVIVNDSTLTFYPAGENSLGQLVPGFVSTGEQVFTGQKTFKTTSNALDAVKIHRVQETPVEGVTYAAGLTNSATVGSSVYNCFSLLSNVILDVSSTPTSNEGNIYTKLFVPTDETSSSNEEVWSIDSRRNSIINNFTQEYKIVEINNNPNFTFSPGFLNTSNAGMYVLGSTGLVNLPLITADREDADVLKVPIGTAITLINPTATNVTIGVGVNTYTLYAGQIQTFVAVTTTSWFPNQNAP